MISVWNEMRRLRRGTALAVLLSLAATQLAFAQASERGPDKQQPAGATLLDKLTLWATRGFDAIGVRGDAVYATPKPVSAVEGSDVQLKNAGSISQAVRSVPGTFTRETGDQPGVKVNIRGLQGQGRVNSMIDGVPQTFSNLSGHGGTFDTLLYMQPELLGGVSVERGAVSGAAGAGTLNGAANFRTLDFDDILMPGRDYGGMTAWKAGTNGYRWSGLVTGALRTRMFPDGSGKAGIMAAIAETDQENYRNGAGQEYPYDASQNPRGGLIKMDFEPSNDHRLRIGGGWYDSSFYVGSASYDWTIKNKTAYLNYRYAPGDDLVDLRINAYANETYMAFDGRGGMFRGREGTNRSLGFNADNTSSLDLGNGLGLTVNYGAMVHQDDYEGNEMRGANPDGVLTKGGAFSEATLSYGMFDLTGGLRYDSWHLSGASGYERPGTGNCPPGGAICPMQHLLRSDGVWNPKVTLAAAPLDWLQLYATYAHTYRPPTASEMLYPGGHNFDGTSDPINNNPYLDGESSRGWDIGFNFSRDGVISADDAVRLKVGYFDNRIRNFIRFDIDEVHQPVFVRWVNTPGIVSMNGVEIEGSYDLGYAYLNLSYTHAETRQPLGYFAGMGHDVGRLPEQYATIDIGARLFEERLTLGGKVRYIGDSVQALGNEDYSIKLPAYTLFDVYGSWKISERAEAFFTVENLTNELYRPAVAGLVDSMEKVPTGRGRTAVFGASVKF